MSNATGQRTYELTFLVPASVTDADYGKVKDEVAAVLKKHKAEVVSNDDWGKKKMAYKIRHAGSYHTEARYAHIVFKGDSLKVPQLEKDIYLNTGIMRHLLVVADDSSNKNDGKEVKAKEQKTVNS